MRKPPLDICLNMIFIHCELSSFLQKNKKQKQNKTKQTKNYFLAFSQQNCNFQNFIPEMNYLTHHCLFKISGMTQVHPNSNLNGSQVAKKSIRLKPLPF